MNLTGAGLVEDYREMILGEIAEQIDVGRLFAESHAGGRVNDGKMDEWVRGAVQSVERWRNLFSPGLGMKEDALRLKPSLTSDDFKTAFQTACEAQAIQLRETRNSQKQFVPGVFNFDLPAAFRDPIFRPSRTIHVAFDRSIYGAVRGQDLGAVRGQPIRPVLCGFGEPFTDWVFQIAMNARHEESAFTLSTPNEWQHGAGWLLVYALRWIGRTRRLAAPDSLALVFVPDTGEPEIVATKETTILLKAATGTVATGSTLDPGLETAAKKCAQQVLRESVATRGGQTRSTAGFSTLMIVRIE